MWPSLSCTQIAIDQVPAIVRFVLFNDLSLINTPSEQCHPGEGRDPLAYHECPLVRHITDHGFQQKLPSKASVQRQAVPAFAGMTLLRM